MTQQNAGHTVRLGGVIRGNKTKSLREVKPLDSSCNDKSEFVGEKASTSSLLRVLTSGHAAGSKRRRHSNGSRSGHAHEECHFACFSGVEEAIAKSSFSIGRNCGRTLIVDWSHNSLDWGKTKLVAALFTSSLLHAATLISRSRLLRKRILQQLLALLVVDLA